MNIYSISDLHLTSGVNKPMDIFKGWDNHIDNIIKDWKDRVKSCDIVLLCGDLSWAMNSEQVKGDIELIGGLPGHKVIIKGNHDYWWGSITKLRESLPKDMFALQNDSIRLDNVVICGTRGWTNQPKSEQDKKIYNREVERLKLSLSVMQGIVKPSDTVIAMAHYPPYLKEYKRSEFSALYTQYNVKTVVYGHLHGQYNSTPKLINLDGTDYILTSCDLVGHKLVKIM